MFGLFKRDPKKKLQQDYERKLQAAMEASRNGDMRANATLTEEADALLAEIERLKQLQKKNKTIRQEEIEFMEEQLHACTEVISSAKYELQAVRLVIAQ